MAVDLVLAKAQLRVTSSSEDDLIALYLRAAQGWVENFTGKKLIRGEVNEQFRCFAPWMRLAWGPEAASASVAYVDRDGSDQSMAARISGYNLLPPLHAIWPTVEAGTAIVATYTAGFADVPPALDQAVLLLLGDYYDNRMAGSASPATTAAVTSLCNPYCTILI